MAGPSGPAVPTVRAPQRLDGASAPEAAPPSSLTSVPTGTEAFPSGNGAQVTAVVGGAPTAPPGTPTTTSSVGPPPVSTPGLARTGADTALLLTFAVVALLLGALLVRLGTPRPAPRPQGAP